MLGPLGKYGIAKSLVQTPGWKPLEAEQNEMLPGGGGGGGGFSMRGGGGGEYRGRIGADTSSLPPSQRGLYENSAPSLAAIQSSYDANMATGRYTHEEAMKIINDQADRDKKFWADGFAKDPNFSENLQKKSYALMTTQANQDSLKLARDRATIKNTQGQTVNDQLRASRGVFNQAPKVGSWSPGGTVKAPLAKTIRRRSAGRGSGLSSRRFTGGR
jgi:hypothetical protein